MAFGKKYYSSYKSNNNLDYYLEIFVEDYSSTSSELTIGAGGPVIEYETDQEDRFSPIISSSCKIPFLVKDNTDATFIDSLRTTYQERQIYVHLYRSDSSGYSSVSPLWSGFLVMDLGKGVDKSFPYVQELKFVDGLALLKDIDFVDLSNPTYEDRVQGNYVQENMYYGPGTYIFWLREILLKSGAALTTQGATENYRFTTSINWYNGDMDSAGQSDDPLQKTKCQVSMFHRKDDKDVYFPDNCYNVLKELLRHWGARITYWKHQFWIVQIPEYITGESGTIDNPQNNNSRVYTYTGALQGTQDHLGSTYWTRYFQEISNTKISKLTGTTYDYLPILKQVNADFLSFASENKFGGLPFGATAPTQEVFQGTINTPSAADFLFLSIPLDWQWDLSNAPNFPSGHTNGWWASIKFNFYASDGSTTYYLQYNSSSQTLPYYWVDSANWQPLGNRSPKYTISSKQITVNGHVGFEEQIPFKDENGNAIVMSGAWSFFLDIEDYGTSSSNPGSFYLNFSGYGSPQRMRNPGTAIQLPAGSGIMSGTVSWSNTLQDPQGYVTISTIQNPAGFNAGTVANDIRFATTSPFLGLLQLMTNTQSAAFGESYNTMNTSSTAAQENSEQFDFGTLLWGDVTDEFARSSLQVYDGSTYENTNQSGLWGRGTLLGTKTFTQLLIDEFLYGQTKIVITPNMRLAVGEANKDQTQGGVTRPRYVNPIGKLRETRDGADPEYFFRRGSFHTLLDEWDYEGYQILRNVVTTTTQTNGMGNKGGTQANTPNQQAMIQNPVVQALAQNSPIAYLRETVNATGSDVAVNGNFNVATGWTLGTGWTIDTTEKVAKFAATGSTSDLVQSVLTQELTYQVNFRVVVTAGTLTVKAGTSGDTQVISSSGDYSIYLTCEGSNDIKFQAGTTFTGNITFITLRDQKSLTSVPIEEIGSAVFKTGDTFNLINENQDEPLVLTVTANQGSTDTTISVSSTPLYEDITPNSYLLINQDDLSAQYQNKTKGTVGGFDITANSIDSGSVSIESYIDDDTFATASATSLATSESIKAYVDTQVGSADTLQEVTDNGNTTTNSIMIGSSSSPTDTLDVSGNIRFVNVSDYLKFANDFVTIKRDGSNFLSLNGFAGFKFNETNGAGELMRLTSTGLGIGTTSPAKKLTVTTSTTGDGILGITSDGNDWFRAQNDNSTTFPVGTLRLYYGTNQNVKITALSNEMKLGDSQNNMTFFTASSERMRLNSTGLGIGTTSPAYALDVASSGATTLRLTSSGTGAIAMRYENVGGFRGGVVVDNNGLYRIDSTNIQLNPTNNVGIGTSSPSEKLEVYSNGSNVAIKIHEDAGTHQAKLHLRRGGSDWEIINDNHLTIEGEDTERLRIVAGTGNLLINRTSDAGSRVQVDGEIRIYNANFDINSDGYGYRFGAGDCGIFHTGYNMTFKNYNGSSLVENMRLTSDGYLGINNSSPATNLHVGTGSGGSIDSSYQIGVDGSAISGIQILSGSSQSGRIVFGDSNNTSIGMLRYEHSDNSMRFRVNGSERARITSGGNLLIGTTTDDGSNKLQVNGKGYFNGNVIIENNKELRWKDSSGNERTILELTNANDLYFGGSFAGSLIFIGGGSYTERARISDSGNFLIGTTTDDGSTKLQVAGDGDIITAQRGTFTVKTSLTSVNHNILSTGKVFNFGTTDSQGLFFMTNNSVRMNITSGGNVLIGTTTDGGEKLVVSGNILITGNDYYGIKFANASGTTKSLIYQHANYDAIVIKDIVNNSDRFIFKNNGNLLIGTTTDDGSSKLQVEGNVKVGDGYLLSAGSGLDLRLKHDGTDSFIFNETGDLYIQNKVDDKDIIFQCDDGSGGVEEYFRLDGSISSGNPFTVFPDNSHLAFGDSQDLQIDHDGNHSVIYNKTGHLYISNDSNDGDIILRSDDGSGGVTEYFRLDGGVGYMIASKAIRALDSINLQLGTSADLTLQHDGTNSKIDSYTSDLYIRNFADDKDIIFQCDDGTGGLADYIRIDGSQTTVNVYKNLLINTTTDVGVPLYVNGVIRAVGGGIQAAQDYGFTLNDESGSNRYGLKFGAAGTVGGSNLLMLTNRSFNSATGGGEVAIGGNTNTSGVSEVEIARFIPRVSATSGTQKKVSLDAVLELTEQTAPANPASGESIIWMDSESGDLKVKINYGGTTVTRVLAAFEG